MRSLPKARTQLCAVAIGAVGAVAAPASAGAANTVVPLRAGPLPAPLFAKPFRDRVLRHAPKGARAAALAAPERPVTAPDGQIVQVAVSPSYPDPAQQAQLAQNAVNFLATRAHGTELAQLHVFIAKPTEVHTQCGAQEAVACYFPGEHRMYVPGEPDPSGIPTEYVITHEYGHHIATFRKNALDDAFLIGPEYWATYEHICAGVLSQPQRYYPGDQDIHYLDNPGEGWADSYAHLPEHYPNFQFQFNQSFTRDQGAYDAIHRDIATPWAGTTTQTFTGTGGSSRSTQTFVQTVSLDGPVIARLQGRRGAKYSIAGRAVGKTLKTNKLGSNIHLNGVLCPGPDSASTTNVKFKVKRIAGSGPFTLTVEFAG